MESLLIDNVNTHLGDDLKQSIRKGSKLSIAAASFSIYAFEALKKELENSDLRNRFTINVFKNNGTIQGAPSNNYMAPAQIIVAFNEIEKQFYSDDNNEYVSEEIGSLFMEVDFPKTKPTYITKIKSRGFSYSEIENTIKAIKKTTIG